MQHRWQRGDSDQRYKRDHSHIGNHSHERDERGDHGKV